MKTQVALKFYPNQKNPARSGGKGVWRVDGHVLYSESEPAIEIRSDVGETPGRRLLVIARRFYKHGSRVDPLRIALAAK